MPAHDPAQKRRSVRRGGRERGCWLYVPMADLLAAGIDPAGPPPLYRTWGTRRGGLMARLYKREPDVSPGAPFAATANTTIEATA